MKIEMKRQSAKRKIIKEWDAEDVYKLIEMVKANECIWNPNDNAYQKNQRPNAWKSISEQFDDKYLTSDLSTKWSNLRAQYRENATKPETPKWRFYNAMRFLGRAEDQQYINDSTEINTSNHNDYVSQRHRRKTSITDKCSQDTMVQQQRQPKSNSAFEVEEDSNSSEPLSTLQPPLPKLRLSLSKILPSSATQTEDNMLESPPAIGERKPNAMDPNMCFANYLISELKTLDDDDASVIRHRITLQFLQCLEESRQEKI